MLRSDDAWPQSGVLSRDGNIWCANCQEEVFFFKKRSVASAKNVLSYFSDDTKSNRAEGADPEQTVLKLCCACGFIFNVQRAINSVYNLTEACNHLLY